MSEEILIVDNEEKECDWIIKGLEKKFEYVKIFSCGGRKEAIKIIRERNINVVITDMRMLSDDDGYSLLRFTKIKRPKTQVIVFTAYSNVEDGVKCVRAGCIDYIEKGDLTKLSASTREAIEASICSRDMDSLNERLIIAEWKELKEKGKSSADKGKTLENLCYLLFRSIPGWESIMSNKKSRLEEFDLEILNESKDKTWRDFGKKILVECKNYSKKKSGVNQVGPLLNKIRRRHPRKCNLGFIISPNGFADTIMSELNFISKEEISIIPMAIKELNGLIFSEDRNNFLKDLLMRYS